MDKHVILERLEEIGIVKGELAKLMGMTEIDFDNTLSQKEIPDTFLRKIEKVVGKENIFIIPEIGDNNTFGLMVKREDENRCNML